MTRTPIDAIGAKPLTVRIEPQGWTFESGPRESLFEAARAAGVRLPTSCRNGTCRACISVLMRGSVRYRVEWPGLSSTEKEEGYVLPCVAIALEPLVLHVPEAERIASA